ncbi:MAG: hypothetical protein ACRD15_17345 [Vicinamibacterales bacterium]
MKRARDPGAYVLLFFLCFFVLLSSGRIASSDAGHQLQASVMLALTGRLGDDGGAGQSAGPSNDAWVRAPNGRLYQAHDIGNIALMLPSAWLGSRLSAASDAEDMRNPPALSKVGVSLSCACLAALGCFWLFRLFALYWDQKTAFLLALAFPATTIFIAYARAAWDVLGGSIFVCGVLYYSAALLRSMTPGRASLLLAGTLAGACSFRFALAPFLVPAAGVVLFSARRSVPARSIAASVLLLSLLMLPSLAYNLIRTGSPFRPATASEQYLQGANALTGNLAHGLYGLFLSPNRGLFLFSPVLLFAIAVPLLWRRLQPDQRKVLVCYGTSSFAYVLLIAKMENWGAFGWGPRYLVPILPVVFVAASIGLQQLYRPVKPLVVASLVFSAALTLPPAVINWHLATTTFDGAADPYGALPFQQVAGWRALAWGLQGTPLPVSQDVADDPLRATTGTFPDLLIARVAHHSRAGLCAVVIFGTAGVLVALLCARRALVQGATAPDCAGLPAGPEHHG